MHPVNHGVASGQHQHRRREATLPHQTAQVEIGSTRKHHIEDDDVVRGKQQQLPSVLERCREYRIDGVLAKTANDRVAEGEVIVNSEDARGWYR